jgi:hypothetical protein
VDEVTVRIGSVGEVEGAEDAAVLVGGVESEVRLPVGGPVGRSGGRTVGL